VVGGSSELSCGEVVLNIKIAKQISLSIKEIKQSRSLTAEGSRLNVL
jgi:hypothetical protein